MDLPNWFNTAVLILVIASLPSVAWFFWMRRTMLRRQAAIIRSLEEKLKPKDKQYWLIGYLVGFAAKYTLRDPQAPRVWITYTTPPYHVFFYLPVIILGRKKERLEIAVEPTNPRLLPGTAYIYKPRIATVALRVRKARARGGKWNETTIKINKSTYKALYNNPQALTLAQKLAQTIQKQGVLQMAFVDASEKTIGVSLGIDKADPIPRYVSKTIEIIKSL